MADRADPDRGLAPAGRAVGRALAAVGGEGRRQRAGESGPVAQHRVDLRRAALAVAADPAGAPEPDLPRGDLLVAVRAVAARAGRQPHRILISSAGGGKSRMRPGFRLGGVGVDEAGQPGRALGHLDGERHAAGPARCPAARPARPSRPRTGRRGRTARCCAPRREPAAGWPARRTSSMVRCRGCHRLVRADPVADRHAARRHLDLVAGASEPAAALRVDARGPRRSSPPAPTVTHDAALVVVDAAGAAMLTARPAHQRRRWRSSGQTQPSRTSSCIRSADRPRTGSTSRTSAPYCRPPMTLRPAVRARRW